MSNNIMGDAGEKSLSIRSFSINCDFGHSKQIVAFQAGYPEPDSHPIAHQAKRLQGQGGAVPMSIMEAIKKLYDLSKKNNTDFPQLLAYAMATAEENVNQKEANANKQKNK